MIIKIIISIIFVMPIRDFLHSYNTRNQCFNCNFCIRRIPVHQKRSLQRRKWKNIFLIHLLPDPIKCHYHRLVCFVLNRLALGTCSIIKINCDPKLISVRWQTFCRHWNSCKDRGILT